MITSFPTNPCLYHIFGGDFSCNNLVCNLGNRSSKPLQSLEVRKKPVQKLGEHFVPQRGIGVGAEKVCLPIKIILTCDEDVLSSGSPDPTLDVYQLDYFCA